MKKVLNITTFVGTTDKKFVELGVKELKKWSLLK